ncbi:pyridoxamine 5'-phosphate oxidase [Blattabacterium cuenoti]|uniref:pyridoxamine 5'-phosphate oxidase n=1 Tax=Blattabacterium cuenoti TaxID=1653831 RepID=UPI00163C22A8|nr:pyridoxamine 5'-phosphate oxidase [Blattabacterium cuenoti]
MITDLSRLRKNYKKRNVFNKIPDNPFYLFDDWFQNEILIQKKNNINQEVNAMSLSTIGKDGGPETRIVLLKEYSKNGFIFYTNYLSSKGISIKNFPKVCLSFFWNRTDRQIIIKGVTSKLKIKKSNEYFDKRPIENQLSSWSSRQSTFILNKDFLEKKYKKWSFFFKNKKITRPFYWGGYIVSPYKIEFWQGQPNRLHNRLVYQLKEDKIWIVKQLSP